MHDSCSNLRLRGPLFHPSSRGGGGGGTEWDWEENGKLGGSLPLRTALPPPILYQSDSPSHVGAPDRPGDKIN